MLRLLEKILNRSENYTKDPFAHSPTLCMSKREQTKDDMKSQNNPVYMEGRGKRENRKKQKIAAQSVDTQHSPHHTGAPCPWMFTILNVHRCLVAITSLQL